MATMREIKRRLNSVQSSQKITGAMRMIASAHLQKVEGALKKALPFEEQLQAMLDHINIAESLEEFPLGEEREIRRVALITIGSEEGLCGAYNNNVLKKLTEVVSEYHAQINTPIQLYNIGKKLNGGMRRLSGVQLNTVPDFFSAKQYAEGVKALADTLMDQFLKKEIDKVEIIYTHYKSMGSQIVQRVQLLPLLPKNVIIPPEQAGTDTQKLEFYYIYEPDRETILSQLYPQLIRTIFYKCMLESKNSEEAVRIMSMQTANDNANKLIAKLRLEYNKLRQQNITTELLDIMGGVV